MRTYELKLKEKAMREKEDDGGGKRKERESKY